MSTKGILNDGSVMVGAGGRFPSRNSSLPIPAPVLAPRQRCRCPTMMSQIQSQDDAGSYPLTSNHTAIPMDDIARPVGCLEIVEWAPSDASKRKYKREVHYFNDVQPGMDTKIKGMKSRFKRIKNISGWTVYTCPEGKLLFHHEQNSVMTITNLLDRKNIEEIEIGVATILEDLNTYRAEHADVPSDIEICVCKATRGDEDVIAYYFASMTDQSVFWLKDVEEDIVTEFERKVVSEAHLGLAMQYQFWIHVEIFPCHRGLSNHAVQELQDAFNYGLCDYLTSSSSMFPWDTETTILLRKCVNSIHAGRSNPNDTVIAARLLSTIYRERFLAFWGEPGARLDRHDTALKKSTRRPRSWIFALISPFLFFMPILYMNEFDKLYVDDTVHYYFWRMFIAGLKRDWENSITPATVLLSANVGFLAIQSIDTGKPDRSVAQIISYISAVLSLFVYIVCQILTRHHRHHANEQATSALNYIIKSEKRLLGLQAVAIAFSLPTALFIWSMLTFLAAMVVVFFDGTSSVTKISISSVLLILLIMVALLLYLERDDTVSGATSPYVRIYCLILDAIQTWWQYVTRWIPWQKGSSSNDSLTEVAPSISSRSSKWRWFSISSSTPSPRAPQVWH